MKIIVLMSHREQSAASIRARMHELLGNPKEVILFVGGFLHNVEESILHYQLSYFLKLVVQEKILVLAVVPPALAE